jgi:hypothetical protein
LNGFPSKVKIRLEEQIWVSTTYKANATTTTNYKPQCDKQAADQQAEDQQCCHVGFFFHDSSDGIEIKLRRILTHGFYKTEPTVELFGAAANGDKGRTA